jgi:hypothetical protein
VKIFSLNVEGYKRNKLYLSEVINDEMPMLFFLQETWLPQYSESALSSDYPDYRFLISSDDLFSQPEDRLGLSDHVWHGTAIGWHRDLHSSVKQLKLVNERFAGIKIECGKMSVLALSLYLPTSGKDDEFSECLSSLSNFIDENCDPSDSILIGADTNCSESQPLGGEGSSITSVNSRLSRKLDPCLQHSTITILYQNPILIHS